MALTFEELFGILGDGVPEDDGPEEETPGRSAVAAPVEAEWVAHIPEGALPYLSCCQCPAAALAADGGTIPHHFRHHVRFILFEE